MDNLYVVKWKEGTQDEDGEFSHVWHLRSDQKLSGPRFATVCRQLLADATQAAVKKHGARSPVGWPHIAQELVKQLEKKGFEVFEPNTFVVVGDHIIQNFREVGPLSRTAAKAVIEHNMEVEKNLYGRVVSDFGGEPDDAA